MIQLVFKSASEYGPDYWEPSYEERYYNNVVILALAFTIVAEGGATAYRVWSGDIKDGCIGAGDTLNEAKTNFMLKILDRIYGRNGGIHLVASEEGYHKQAANSVRQKMRNANFKIVSEDFIELVIFPTELPTQ